MNVTYYIYDKMNARFELYLLQNICCPLFRNELLSKRMGQTWALRESSLRYLQPALET
jgi:hypothetical protein